MTTIGSTSSMGFRPPTSPRDMLKSELGAEISAGTISATDETALSSAIDTIDGVLSSAAEAGRSSGSAPPSAEEMQEKVSSLIDDQVEAGKLTEDQASQLKEVFENTFANGPQGAGGPPPGPPPSDDTGAIDGSTTSSTDLGELLKQLQQALSSSNKYGENGTTTASAENTGLVLNLVA